MSKGSGGGGYGSRNIVEPRVRTGSGSKGVNPGGAGQLGAKQGSHVTRSGDSNYRGERLHNDKSFQPVPFGNQVALNVKGGGPGKGRDVMACGSQGTHGATNPGSPRPPGRGILTNE
jgi:hypothetical protein